MKLRTKNKQKWNTWDNDTVEKKQKKNQYSDQTNTELESEKPTVTNINEMVFSSEEKTTEYNGRRNRSWYHWIRWILRQNP